MKTFKELYKSYPGKGWLDDDEIPKIKPTKNNTKIKYKPNKKELGEYGNYIIENNENFVIIMNNML